LLCGGAGVLSAMPAAADPGTIGNNHGGRGADGGSASNDSGAAGRTGGHRPEVLGGARRQVEPPVNPSDPGYDGPPQYGWPCLPLPYFPPIALPPLPLLHFPQATVGDGVGTAAPPRLHIAPPPESGGGGGGGGGGISVAPQKIPPLGEPGQPGEPSVVGADGGTVGPATGEPPPITVPPLIGLPRVFQAPPRPIGPGSEPGPRSGPDGKPTMTRERPPATSAGASTEVSASTRVGYPTYLRDAKMGEVAAVALSGFAGLAALTAFGGVVGYRQAKAGHIVRTTGTTRFVQ
jgi:hypothetical protein